jgi:hypothetical protein
MVEKNEQLQSLEDLFKEDAGKGLERYEEDKRIGYVKLTQALSKEVTEEGMQAGCLINSRTKVVLANSDKCFEFFPIYYFRDYTIWDGDFNIVQRSTKRETFTEEQLRWIGKTPPIVQEGINFVVIPANGGSTPMIMSFSRTIFKSGVTLVNLVQDIMVSKSVPMFGSIYSIGVEKVTKGKHSWYILGKAKYVKQVPTAKEYVQLREAHSEISKLDLEEFLAKKEDSTEVAEELPANPNEQF